MDIIIKKIEEGMTGQQVADLLYDNFLTLAKKCEEFPEENVNHLIDKYISTLRGDLYTFIRTIFEECFGDKKFFEEVCEYIDIYFYSDDIVKKLYDVINNLIDIYLTTGDMLEYIETILIRETERVFENADSYPELVTAFKKYIREVILGEYRGNPNGIAALDTNGKVPVTQLPYSSDTQDGIITSSEHKLLNTTLPNKINVLNGNASVTGSVDQKVATAVTNLVNGAPTAYDTLKEIADWIATSEADASDLVAKLNKLENEHDTDIAGLAQKDTSLQDQINQIKAKTDNIAEDADSVSFSATYTNGTKIGTITINGVATDIYIPIWNGTLAQYNQLDNKQTNYIYNIVE